MRTLDASRRRACDPLGGVALVIVSLGWLAAVPVAHAESAMGVPGRVRAEVVSFLRARAPAGTTSIDVPLVDSFALPEGAGRALDIRLRTRHRGPFVGRIPVTVRVLSGGRELRRGVVTAVIRSEARVLVASRSVRKGEVIGVEHIGRERRDLGAIRGRPVTDAAALVGMRAARSVSGGSVWREEFVEPIPVVERGQPVTMRIERGGLRIDAQGIAREDGRAGETIRVLNGKSRREVAGRLDSHGVVHVSF